MNATIILGEVARREARSAIGVTKGLSAGPLQAAGTLSSFFDALVRRPLARVIHDRAIRISRSAVVFQGAAGTLENEPREFEVDPDGSLRALIDETELKLKQSRDSMANSAADLRAADGRQSGLVRDAFTELSTATEAARVAIREFGSVLQAHDANVIARKLAAEGGHLKLASFDDELHRLCA